LLAKDYFRQVLAPVSPYCSTDNISHLSLEEGK
jgi:hypothetical protein